MLKNHFIRNKEERSRVTENNSKHTLSSITGQLIKKYISRYIQTKNYNMILIIIIVRYRKKII